MSLLKTIRLYELDQVLRLFPPACKVLEIGAGAGWQARVLSESGHAVEAIDVSESLYATHREFPVREYGGVRIPYPDHEFDVVFSSNTLEHIPRVEFFQEEIRRVLRPGGVVVHIVPTASWRLWTSLAHYVFILRMALTLLGLRNSEVDSNLIEHKRARRTIAELAFKVLISPRHGERGSALSELWLFSRFGWRRLVWQTGWDIEYEEPLRLFYTGYLILGSHLGLPMRNRLSRVLGSSTRLYVLRCAKRKRAGDGT